MSFFRNFKFMYGASTRFTICPSLNSERSSMIQSVGMYLVWDLCDTEILTLCFPSDKIFVGTITGFNVGILLLVLMLLFRQFFSNVLAKNVCPTIFRQSFCAKLGLTSHKGQFYKWLITNKKKCFLVRPPTRKHSTQKLN